MFSMPLPHIVSALEYHIYIPPSIHAYIYIYMRGWTEDNYTYLIIFKQKFIS